MVIYWCVQVGPVCADPETEKKRPPHWDRKDEKDINKSERMLFSINSFIFSHLPDLNQNI